MLFASAWQHDLSFRCKFCMLVGIVSNYKLNVFFNKDTFMWKKYMPCNYLTRLFTFLANVFIHKNILLNFFLNN